MLTRAQINKSVNDKIKAEFPGIPFQSSDAKEGFARPSFFVSIETNRMDTSQFNSLREMTCRIRFFPTDRFNYKEEAYDVQDRLEKLFGLQLAVADRVITIQDAETEIIDAVVYFGFNFSYYEDAAQQESGETMQELRYDG